MAPVIVFGPTGNVGSHAARTAEKHGAKVYLAMRDTSKAIPGLTSDHENSGKFERVQADLNNADSVAAAIKSTGATRAFVYLAHGQPDHMMSTFSAMKSAGITFVVFLSSYTIAMAGPEPADVQPSEIISYMHAQAELSLREIFGEESYVALRPGNFATNSVRYKSDIAAGEVEMLGASFPADGITPNDMGEVGGTILALGPKNGQHIVYLYGPEMLTQGATSQIVGRVLGKEVKLKSQTPEVALEQMTRMFGSKPLAEYMVRMSTRDYEGAKFPYHEEGVENIQLYTDRPATKFEDWVKANKELFST
ncbi:hypothetical protein LTR49_028290 [Elasticomyces elasticus]|nr:hypothetical protein LTR49_028290 [Elasticomyces elasticus]